MLINNAKLKWAVPLLAVFLIAISVISVDAYFTPLKYLYIAIVGGAMELYFNQTGLMGTTMIPFIGSIPTPNMTTIVTVFLYGAIVAGVSALIMKFVRRVKK